MAKASERDRPPDRKGFPDGQGVQQTTCREKSIYRRGVEVGDARLSDCIEVSDPRRNEDKFWERVDHAIITDPGYRHKVVLCAISSARKNFTEIQSELPDLYLRKTA